MGRAVRLGAIADGRGRGLAALRLQRRRGPHFAEVAVAGETGISQDWHHCGEVRRGAPWNGCEPRHPVRVWVERGGFRVDECGLYAVVG